MKMFFSPQTKYFFKIIDDNIEIFFFCFWLQIKIIDQNFLNM